MISAVMSSETVWNGILRFAKFVQSREIAKITKSASDELKLKRGIGRVFKPPPQTTHPPTLITHPTTHMADWG